MMKLRRTLASLAFTCGMLLVSQVPATAAPSPDVVNGAVEKTTKNVSSACLEAVAKGKGVGAAPKQTACEVTTTSKTSEARRVTAADIKADASLKSADRTEMVQALSYGAIYSKHFSWFTTGGGYTVTHNGTFYYNGWKAWATTPYAAYGGSHYCFVNYAFMVSINTQQCYETGNDFERDFYFQWQVAWPAAPPYFGLSYTVSHWGSVYANGTTS
ncbi:hypothetical protein [Paenarthrobacter ureafaciens]|uniref:hypothetical protein n=1 Tax=Paenarthrobacter ureafaciens TaxID=37931 RepID=UPI001FB4E8C3|nr:hypothetical protein [Paenarthrobacter ureafaciens]UOD82307.1 hypothetical protein MQZ73_05415 [Paenarthrobacter ureafaciens]WNZ05805.1 hypothetical protein PVT25_09965 [Paenarthrobacter ureafaciens]